MGLAQAQTTPWFMCLETSSDAIDSAQGGTVFKPEVPYKHHVRLVTNEFQVPWKGSDPARETDLYVQFFEHLVKNHKTELQKFRRHFKNVRSQCGQIYSPSDVAHKLVARPPGTNFGYEIIRIDDFKYTPRKPIPPGQSEGWKQAEQIIVHGK